MTRVNYKVVGGIFGGVVGAALITYLADKMIERVLMYDAEGYDSQGYNKQGYDRQGYNREGFDKLGYDSDGYDVNGYNVQRRDFGGFDKYGFDVDGFDRNGIDRQGYGRDKYNSLGQDRAGYSKQYYSGYFEQLFSRLNDAYNQLQNKNYRYAIFDARILMEDTLKLLVKHSVGQNDVGDSIIKNLVICEKKQLISKEDGFIERLHDVRRICNSNGHELDAADSITHDKVHFVIMQIRDLLNFAKSAIVCA